MPTNKRPSNQNSKTSKNRPRGVLYVFVGIALPLCLILILFLSGCAWFEDKRIVIKPEPVDIRDRWKILARFVKQRYPTEMTVEEIAFELSLAAYQEEISK